MKKQRSDARLRKCERLEDRQMLAADLGTELSFLSDLDVDTLQVSTLEANSVSLSNETDALATTSSNELVNQYDVVLDWNKLFNELLVENETLQNPGYASRAMAMMNLAIYDAVTLANGDSDDTFYDYQNGVLPNARVSAEVTASQAAYTVLSSLYAEQQETIDAFYGSLMTNFRQNRVTSDSVVLGTEIGNQVIANRANDGSDAVVDFTYTEGVGNFQADPLNPDVPVWGPGWGDVETFSISSAEEYAPETTPALTSEEYAASYNEVLAIGSVDSTVRTAEQTEIGIFWAYDRVGMGTPMSLFSEVLETIAIQQGNTLEENAALYAQASVAMADAGIVAWHTKFDEEFWRPVTAIRAGDQDGNALTEGDADWTALGAPDDTDSVVGFTPQFPTYISGHATFGGALFGAIQEFYGTDNISFELTSKELEVLLDNPELQEAYGLDLDDATRSFDSLSEAMAENGRSRVYLGIHFDFDDLVGQEVGQAVAASVASEFVVASDTDKGQGSEGRRRPQRGGNVRGPLVGPQIKNMPGNELDPEVVDAGFEEDISEQTRNRRDRPGRRQEPLANDQEPVDYEDSVDDIFTELGKTELQSELEQEPAKRPRRGRQ